MYSRKYFSSNFYILLLNVLDLIWTLNIEELKSLNYEVDISQTPMKRGEEQALPVIHMTSKHGQEYQCVLPQLEDEDVSEKETISEKNTDIKELLKPMKSGNCLLKGKDWWTYEFCFGHYIKQFHIEDGQIIGQVITLGLFESDYDWSNETDQEKFKHVKQRYHSQYYVNGTKCDLTGQPRNAEVRIFCEEDAGDYIYRVDEPGTCSYIITIHTSRLCSHPQLKPLPSKKAHSIPCHPLLNEDQYSVYIQKYNEEKELANLKRNQWLSHQQARLQVMKKENLQRLEVEELAKLKKESNKDIDEDKSTEVLTGSNDKQENLKDQIPKKDKSQKEGHGEAIQDTSTDQISTKDKSQKLKGDKESIETLFNRLEKGVESLKPISPERITAVKKSIKSYFLKVLDEANEDFNILTDQASYSRLESILDMLSKELDNEGRDVEATKELNKAREASTEATSDVSDDVSIESNDITKDEAGDKKDSLVDENHLSYLKTLLANKQRKNLEQAVKENLEKAGLDTGGRRIEVKIIQAGYYDNEGKDFHTLSDAETNQFQNMIMALLTGQQEAVQEMERHKKLEENYKFTWENDEEKDD